MYSSWAPPRPRLRPQRLASTGTRRSRPRSRRRSVPGGQAADRPQRPRPPARDPDPRRRAAHRSLLSARRPGSGGRSQTGGEQHGEARIGQADRRRGAAGPGPTYDPLDPRRFQFVPLWGIVAFLLYAMRRIACATCKAVVVERVPWASGKARVRTRFAWSLARWAKRMSWEQVAVTSGVSWDTVYAAVKMAVADGRGDGDRRRRGHVARKYLTVVYQINEGCRRLLWIGEDRPGPVSGSRCGRWCCRIWPRPGSRRRCATASRRPRRCRNRAYNRPARRSRRRRSGC